MEQKENFVDVYKAINKIHHIKNVNQVIDAGLKKVVKGTIKFKTKVPIDTKIKIKELIFKNYGLNAKQFVQQYFFYDYDTKLTLIF